MDSTIGNMGGIQGNHRVERGDGKAADQGSGINEQDAFVASSHGSSDIKKADSDRANVDAAKALIQKCLAAIGDAKPDLAKTQEGGKSAEKKLEAMDPHIKSINLDTLVQGCQKDVSADGKALKKISGDSGGDAAQAGATMAHVKADLAEVTKSIDEALAHLNKVKGTQSRSISGAKWELDNAKQWMDHASRDASMSSKTLQNGQDALKEMVPFLDIIERDTVETDVGRFAKDLDELKKDARGGMMDGWLSAKGADDWLNGVKGYLDRALNNLLKP